MRVTKFAGVLLLTAGMTGTACAGSPENRPLEKCGVLAQVNGRESSIVLSSLHVMETTAKAGPFVLPANAPPHVSAVQCGRRSLIPDENDYKVLQAGYPFYIVAPDERMLVMELSNGKLQVRTLGGQLTAAEIPLIQTYLNKAQEHFHVNAATEKPKN